MLKVRPGLPVLLLLCGIIAVVCILYTGNWLLHGPEIVTPKTVVIQEEVFLCGDCRTVYYGPPPSALLGLKVAALTEKYPPAKDGQWFPRFPANSVSSATYKTCARGIAASDTLAFAGITWPYMQDLLAQRAGFCA
ncbi:MAG: hypothetical protein ACUVRC_07815 [Desulfotomaculales bacterium]